MPFLDIFGGHVSSLEGNLSTLISFWEHLGTWQLPVVVPVARLQKNR